MKEELPELPLHSSRDDDAAHINVLASLFHHAVRGGRLTPMSEHEEPKETDVEPTFGHLERAVLEFRTKWLTGAKRS